MVSPHTHRANAAKQAIQTLNAHLKTKVSLVDKDSPLSELDWQLSQAKLTFNLLGLPQINWKLSEYANLSGQFNSNKTSLVPPRIKSFVHDRQDNRSSWEPNGKIAYVIGLAIEHYRYLKVYFLGKRCKRLIDTAFFLPSDVLIPKV